MAYNFNNNLSEIEEPAMGLGNQTPAAPVPAHESPMPPSAGSPSAASPSAGSPSAGSPSAGSPSAVSPGPVSPTPIPLTPVTSDNPESAAGVRFRSCRWMQKEESGNQAFCTHREVKPYAGMQGFDPDAWCPECQYYKLRRAPRKRSDEQYTY